MISKIKTWAIGAVMFVAAILYGLWQRGRADKFEKLSDEHEETKKNTEEVMKKHNEIDKEAEQTIEKEEENVEDGSRDYFER